MNYMSVERPTIRNAFAAAHKAACDPNLTPDVQKAFKAIATLIWKSCGEPGPLPASFPAYAEPARTPAQTAHETGRVNIALMHTAADLSFKDTNKYGRSPWGQFYHYMAMELAPHATPEQMDAAIASALRSTEEQEAGVRKATRQ